MHVYLICPVRKASVNCDSIVAGAELDGHTVHYPPRDVDQSDPTGAAICAAHLRAMQEADEVWAVWDSESYGSHFDLGMAFALRKPLRLIQAVRPDTEGKSYLKAVLQPRLGTD